MLRAIAGSRLLREILVFKGGNALDFIWQPNRSTRDLDFSLDDSRLNDPFDAERLRRLLAESLAASTRALGVGLRVQRLEQQPPGSNRTFITYEVRIGYALPDDQGLRARLDAGQPVPTVVPIEISLNEPICATEDVRIDEVRRLRVSTLEDILAEKLRALLQQTIRNRTRRQDLLDIAVHLNAEPRIDRERIARYLLAKAAARSVPVSRAAFHDPELAKRAYQDYAALEPTTRSAFIPFEPALQIVLAFTDSLPIPES